MNEGDIQVRAESQGEEAPVPCAVIYVKEETFLSRWDEGNSGCVQCKSVSKPRRRGSAAHNVEVAKDYRKKSEESGIQLASISLVPLTFSTSHNGRHETTEGESTVLSAALKQLGGVSTAPPKVKVVFCIRREGCGNCRMHGLSLTELAKSLDIELMGIVKEPRSEKQAKHETAKEALYNFHQKYFPYPIFRDKKWDTFKFLGNRKLSTFALVAKIPKLLRLYDQKNIETVVLDGFQDSFIQGGLLVFDAQCKLRYIYYDRYGDELDTDALRLAIEDCQRVTSKQKRLVVAPAFPTRRTAHLAP